MQDIEIQAINNYQANIDFFKNHNEIVYNRLMALETLLENQTFTPKYDLIYEEGYFDVVEIASGDKLYNTNSLEFSKQIVESINLKKDSQSFRSLRKINFEEEAFNKLKDANSYTTFANTAEIYSLYHKNIPPSTHMTEIDKYIFLGVGLAFHLPQAIEKFDFQIIYIVEDNLELFRLSLFTIDYKKALTGRTSYFSIADTPSEFRARFNGFYTNAFFKNTYIKFHLFSSAYASKIEEIRSILIGRPEATYSHNRILEKSRRVLEKINEEYKFLDLRKKENDTYFQDKPWLVLGAGPSLYNNADWIAKNQDKFIIIAAFTALNTLKRIGVKPDIAVQVDENLYTTNEMIEKLGDLSFLDDTLLFFSASISPELFNVFKKENIYLHEDRTKYKLAKSTLTVSSVGDTIYALALIFNTPNIYLLGIDLALGADGSSHTPDHFKTRSIQQAKLENKQTDDFHLGDTIIQAKGNFQSTVNTTPLFALSIPVMNNFTRIYKAPHQTIYNLSDGCYLEQTVPTHIKDISLEKDLNKQHIRKEFQHYFDALSTTQLEEKEIDGLYCRKAQLHDYYTLIKKFQNSSYIDSERFLASVIILAQEMINHECIFEIKDIMTIYYMNITPYIDDFFHTKELKNKKKFTKKFKHILVKNINKIVKTYDEDLHRLNILQEKKHSQVKT
ncbi:motility associated factor glycosyltransferase family protein [Sulfurimonas sp.]